MPHLRGIINQDDMIGNNIDQRNKTENVIDQEGTSQNNANQNKGNVKGKFQIYSIQHMII